MNGSRIIPLALIIMMALTVLPLLSEQVSAGEPIFTSSIEVSLNETKMPQSHQVPKDIEVDQNGRIYIVYHSRSSYYYDIHITHSDNYGRTWVEHSEVDDALRDGNESNDKSDQMNPSMFIAPNGTVYVAWQDKRDINYDIGHQQDIRIAWAEDGENFSRSVRIDPPKAERNWWAADPIIEMNDQGRIVCCWRDKNLSGAFYNIWSAYSDDYGITWSQPQVINHDGLHERTHKRLGMAVYENHVYAIWQDDRGDQQLRPYLAISHDGGETWSDTDKRVTDDLEPENRRNMPWIDVDDTGRLYIVWKDERSGRYEIWMTTSDDNGTTLTSNDKVTFAQDENYHINPCIAAKGEGHLALAYQRRRVQDGETDEGDLMFTRSMDGGETWSDPIRVDDSDRGGIDTTTQSHPRVAIDNFGRSLVTWDEGSHYYNWGSDVYFSRFSGGDNVKNFLPEIFNLEFTSKFLKFDRNISSSETDVTYRCNYRDENNDEPASGYPRVHLYSDPEGNDPLLEEPVPMELSDPTDFDLMDRNTVYEAEFNSTYEGQTWWQVEVVDEQGSEPVFSDIIMGPLLDNTDPEITLLEPKGRTWVTTDHVECSALITDEGGGSPDKGSFKINKSVFGADQFERGEKIDRYEKIDNNTYKVWVKVYLEPGVDNYIRFLASDRVGNGPAYSDVVNVWVDAEAPFFTDVDPSAREEQLYEEVNCSIVCVDHLPGSTNIVSSGLDTSSVRYRYRTTSDDYNDWMVPEGMEDVGNGAYRFWTTVVFEDEGVYNYIQWRAKDDLGQIKNTGELRINVQVPDNYPPRFMGEAYPKVVNSESPHIFWEDAYDEEGDPLYYRIMLMDYPSRLFKFSKPLNLDRRTFYDVKMKLDPGFYLVRINVTDRIGGYDIYEHIFEIVTNGTPPPDEVGEVGPYYISDPNSTISWPPTPSESEMDINYMIRIGTETWRGDVTGWYDVGDGPGFKPADLNLTLGTYSLQVMARSGNNYSRVREGLLKICDYSIEFDYPSEHTAYRGRSATRADSMIIDLTNLAHFQDNVTIELQGEIAERGWVEFQRSYSTETTLELESQKMQTIRQPQRILISFFPPEDAEKGSYPVTIKVISENEDYWLSSDPIIVSVEDPPPDSKGIVIADNIYKLLTDLFPFLEPIPKNYLVPGFLIIVAIVISIVAYFGITYYRKGVKKRTTKDPYAEQKRVYKELYGVEPTKEQLEKMVTEGGGSDELTGEGVLDDIPSTGKFDEDFIGSEEERTGVEE